MALNATCVMFYLNSRREKLINARNIASVLFEVLKTVTYTATTQVILFISSVFIYLQLPFFHKSQHKLVRNK